MTPPTARERRVARSRWVDLGLSLLAFAFMAVAGVVGLSFERAYALAWGFVALFFAPLAVYQYRVLDEFTRIRWLKSMAVSALTLFTMLFMLLSWFYWTAQPLQPGHLIAGLMVGWLSSWVTWFYLQRRDTRG